jgi:hypothetical protein
MHWYRRRRLTKYTLATPWLPSRYGRRGSSALLAWLDNATALPAPVRLASAPEAPVTRLFPFYRADS